MGRFKRPVPIALAIALLIGSVASTPSQAQVAPASSVTVGGTGGVGVNFRATPGGAAIGSFRDGTRLTVVGADRQANGRNWRNVRSPDGVVGWVAADYVRGVAEAPQSTTTQAAYRPGAVTGGTLQVVKTGGLNAILRDAPGGAQIASYPEGSNLSLVGSESRQVGGREWRNVQGPDGKTGWMVAFLLTDTGGGGTAAPSSVASSRTTVAASRSPFTLTADMRARALAARARAVPLATNRTPIQTGTQAGITDPTPGSSTGTQNAAPTTTDNKKKKKP